MKWKIIRNILYKIVLKAYIFYNFQHGKSILYWINESLSLVLISHADIDISYAFPIKFKLLSKKQAEHAGGTAVYKLKVNEYIDAD